MINYKFIMVNYVKIREKKIAELSIPLFGKPAWEIPGLEGGTLDLDFAKTLEEVGEELNQRLKEIARVHRILVENGWEAFGTLYDIIYTKNISLNEAKDEMKELGLEEYVEYLYETEVEEVIPETEEEERELEEIEEE